MKQFLITGATGQFGMATISSLLKKGVSPSAISGLVRDKNKSAALEALGIQITYGDYDDYSSLLAAFKDVDQLLFVSGNDMVNRSAQHERVIKAAKEAGVNRIIYTSSLQNPEIKSSAIAFVHAVHTRTEELLAESGISYTLLKNTLYMDMIPVFIGNVVLESGMIYFPADSGKIAFVLRSDMAEATANILLNKKYQDKVYNLTNQSAYSYEDVAETISKITKKKINYVSPKVEEYNETLQKAGVPNEYIGFFRAFALAQAQGEFDVPGNDLQKLLEREPTSLKDYLTTIYDSGMEA